MQQSAAPQLRPASLGTIAKLISTRALHPSVDDHTKSNNLLQIVYSDRLMLCKHEHNRLDGRQHRMVSEGSEPVDVVTRPSSVVWYERLAWAALGLGLVSTVANPAALSKYYHQMPTVYPIMFAASIAGQLLWIWLVARKRQNWARWISLFFILIGIPTTIWDSEQRFQINAVAASFFHVAFAMSAVSVMLLFRADARAWFSRRRFVSGA